MVPVDLALDLRVPPSHKLATRADLPAKLDLSRLMLKRIFFVGVVAAIVPSLLGAGNKTEEPAAVSLPASLSTGALVAGQDPEPLDFAHDVLPILRSNCAKCHTGGKTEGGFSLASRAAMLEFEAVIPGESASSRLVERLTTDDPDLRMPAGGEPLPDKDIATLRRWIDEGARWDEGVTLSGFQRETIRPLQDVAIPPATDAASNPIDRLLTDYYTELGAAAPSEVSDAGFARRVYLDLTGLLPPVEELQAFLVDSSPDKRERLVAELLGRDRQYTEHWLTFWNDLLRNDYAGTGYIDGGRKQITTWLYQSLMDNKPYDQFVRELIDASPESEGFIRGIKWRGRVNASQVEPLQFAQNVSQVFLGVNLKCASCHDSFINEWKLADSYGLAAIVSDEPLEMHRCDNPTGEMARPKSLFGKFGEIDPALPRKERLKLLAAVITGDQQARLARTIVNRLWQRMLGRGLVEPVDVMAGDAWSQDLLDYLATDLVAHDYDLKHTLQLIATSNAYQAQSHHVTETPVTDYVFRGPLMKRMTAEQFVDAVWRITGTTPERSSANFGDRGDEPIRASLVTADLLMRALGRPNREQIVSTRPEELSTLEALDLSNGEILAGLVEQGAERLLQDSAEGDCRSAVPTAEEIARRVYLQALSREPGEAELEIAVGLMGEQPTAAGVSDFLWVVFMLPEFQLIH